MARQIRNGLGRKQNGQRNIESRTNLLGIVKNIFKMNPTEAAGTLPEHATQGNSQKGEATARGPEALLLKRAQMLR